MLTTASNALIRIGDFLRDAGRTHKPDQGQRHNGYPQRTKMADAWNDGRHANDFAVNPYPKDSDLYVAWNDGNMIRQRIDLKSYEATVDFLLAFQPLYISSRYSLRTG